MTLREFETLVTSQQPASQPWVPVTDYSFDSRKAIEGRHPQLIKDVFKPKKVLDVGAGLGHLVRLLRDLNVNAVGLDPVRDRAPLSIVRDGDITDPVDFEESRQYDLVICREVLEHLTIRDIRKAVTNLCELSSRYVYVTTRFHPQPASLLDVATRDDLDPTHISMLNIDLLRVLFVLEGFKQKPGIEALMDWQQKGRVLVYERV